MVFIMSEKEKSYFNNLSVIMQFSKVSRCWNEKLIYYFFKFVFEKIQVKKSSSLIWEGLSSIHEVTPGLFKVPPLSRPTNKQTWSDILLMR